MPDRSRIAKQSQAKQQQQQLLLSCIDVLANLWGWIDPWALSQ